MTREGQQALRRCRSHSRSGHQPKPADPSPETEQRLSRQRRDDRSALAAQQLGDPDRGTRGYGPCLRTNVTVLDRNRDPANSVPCRDRAHPGLVGPAGATTASTLAAAPASLCLRHSVSSRPRQGGAKPAPFRPNRESPSGRLRRRAACPPPPSSSEDYDVQSPTSSQRSMCFGRGLGSASTVLTVRQLSACQREETRSTRSRIAAGGGRSGRGFPHFDCCGFGLRPKPSDRQASLTRRRALPLSLHAPASCQGL
jgi:hypothetical protein